jgi:hypothetical protein
LGLTPKAQATKEKKHRQSKDKSSASKFKTFVHQGTLSTELRGNTDLEQTFAYHTYDKRLISRIYKELP